MRFIYFEQSGKLVDPNGSPVWCLAGVSFSSRELRPLQKRLAGLHRSFRPKAQRSSAPALNARDLLNNRNAASDWSRSYLRAVLKVCIQLEAINFLVVVDKRTATSPVGDDTTLPFAWRVLLRSMAQALREGRETAALILPPGRPVERNVVRECIAQGAPDLRPGSYAALFEVLEAPRRVTPGLEVAAFAACAARRYFECVAKPLADGVELDATQSAIAAAYLGFVKKQTWASEHTNERGVRPRGFHYFWRNRTED